MVAQIPNDTQLRRVLAGTEPRGNQGTLVAPTFKLYGALALTREQPLADRTEYTGTYDGRKTPVRGAVAVSGTYEQVLTYEDFSILPRYLVKGQVTGVTDGNPTPGYTYNYTPSPATHDLDAFSAETGHNANVFTSAGVQFTQATISADIDDAEAAWKWASDVLGTSKDVKAELLATTAATGTTTTVITKTGAVWTVNQFQGAYLRMMSGPANQQVRLIASNTATTITLTDALSATPGATDSFQVMSNFTAGVADRVTETINAPGTKIYVDNAGGTMGTTEFNQGMYIGFSVTWNNNLTRKRFLPNTTSYHRKVGRGMRQVTFQIRAEFENHDEYDKWTANASRLIRIEQLGSAINVAPNTFKRARIDLPAGYWNSVVEDERENNITATFEGWAYLDTTLGYSAKLEAISRLSALP